MPDSSSSSSSDYQIAGSQVVPECYRPAKFVSVGKDAIRGNPDLDFASGTKGTICRGLHGSPRITPAMAAGIMDHDWNLQELIAL
jgi:hypothetical protein